MWTYLGMPSFGFLNVGTILPVYSLYNSIYEQLMSQPQLLYTLTGGRPSGDKTMGFRFPDPKSGNPDFQHVLINQLSKSSKISGHRIFSGFPVFPDFRISGSGIPKFRFLPILA